MLQDNFGDRRFFHSMLPWKFWSTWIWQKKHKHEACNPLIEEGILTWWIYELSSHWNDENHFYLSHRPLSFAMRSSMLSSVSPTVSEFSYMEKSKQRYVSACNSTKLGTQPMMLQSGYTVTVTSKWLSLNFSLWQKLVHAMIVLHSPPLLSHAWGKIRDVLLRCCSLEFCVERAW